MQESGHKNPSRRSILQVLGASAGASTISTAAPVSQISTTARRNPAGPLRIGIVGGRFGATFQWHLHPKAKVTAVCDIRPDALQRLSEVYRCNTTYKGFRELLKHPELDAVGVFTPAPLHAWM